MRNKVVRAVLTPSLKYYGQPKWYDTAGKDYTIDRYVKALGHYTEADLLKAAEKHQEASNKFPSISDVKNILSQTGSVSMKFNSSRDGVFKLDSETEERREYASKLLDQCGSDAKRLELTHYALFLIGASYKTMKMFETSQESSVSTCLEQGHEKELYRMAQDEDYKTFIDNMHSGAYVDQVKYAKF